MTEENRCLYSEATSWVCLEFFHSCVDVKQPVGVHICPRQLHWLPSPSPPAQITGRFLFPWQPTRLTKRRSKFLDSWFLLTSHFMLWSVAWVSMHVCRGEGICVLGEVGLVGGGVWGGDWCRSGKSCNLYSPVKKTEGASSPSKSPAVLVSKRSHSPTARTPVPASWSHNTHNYWNVIPLYTASPVSRILWNCIYSLLILKIKITR